MCDSDVVLHENMGRKFSDAVLAIVRASGGQSNRRALGEGNRQRAVSQGARKRFEQGWTLRCFRRSLMPTPVACVEAAPQEFSKPLLCPLILHGAALTTL